MYVQCPYCGEEIETSFSSCKFCNGDLTYGSIEAIRQAVILFPNLLLESEANEEFIAEVEKIDESQKLTRIRKLTEASEEKKRLELESKRKEEEIQNQILRAKELAEQKAEQKAELRAKKIASMPRAMQLIYAHWKKLLIISLLLISIVFAFVLISNSVEANRIASEKADLIQRNKIAIDSAVKLSNYMNSMLNGAPATGNVLLTPHRAELEKLFKEFDLASLESPCSRIVRAKFWTFFSYDLYSSPNDEFAVKAVFPLFRSDLGKYIDSCSSMKVN